MHQKLDFTDLTILEALAKHGPRNLTEVARRLGFHPNTVRHRVNAMTSSPSIFLTFDTNIYHTNMGLRKAVVLAEAVQGYEDDLFECLKTNSFWLYVCRCYGPLEGSIGIYTIPDGQNARLEQFVDRIKQIGLAQNIRVYWSTCFHSVPVTSNWFDPTSGTWVFPWNEWIQEIKTETVELPYTLTDPEGFPMNTDDTDLFILKELEKNATVDLSAIAKKLGKTRQLINYHFKKHILERGLIESFDVGFFPFSNEAFDMFYFIFNFDEQAKMAKFGSSLLDKPFVYTLGKILGENSLVVNLYLPKREFRCYTDSLSKLIRTGLLQSYEYVIQDLGKTSRQTIPYKNFRKGKWLYDHEKHMAKLQECTNLQAGS